MAAAKKTVKPVAVSSAANAPKAEIQKPETPAAVQAETKKAESPAEAVVKAESSVEAKKEPAKKAAVKKETVKKAAVKTTAAKKTTAKKDSAKKTAKPTAEKKPAAKKTAVKTEIELQISGEKYTQEKLLKIAKDVWEYDLEQKASDLTSVELYIKPDERLVYYVMNKEFTGSFGI